MKSRVGEEPDQTGIPRCSSKGLRLDMRQEDLIGDRFPLDDDSAGRVLRNAVVFNRVVKDARKQISSSCDGRVRATLAKLRQPRLHLPLGDCPNRVATPLGKNMDAPGAFEEQRIYGIPVRGSLRFPRWQFSLGSPAKLIPHLETVLPVLTEHWD